MDKETLSNYGWIVICVLVMVVMIALATPFGSFISEAVQSTTKGLFDVNKSALDSTGLINIDNQEFDVPDMNHGAGENGGSGETPVTPQGNIIPNGGTYYVGVTSVNTGDYTGATATYTAGQEFPETVNDGDVYVYGDYEYRYNYYFATSKWYSAVQNGWGVRVLDMGKSSYGEILGTINGKPLTALSHTFLSCSALVTAPTIPDSVTNMNYAFTSCTSLTTAPIIPNNVTEMKYAFSWCSSLQTAPTIPSSVVTMSESFMYCPLLTGTIKVPCTARTSDAVYDTPATLEKYHYNGCGH